MKLTSRALWMICSLLLFTTACQATTQIEPPTATSAPTASATTVVTIPATLTALVEATPTTAPSPTAGPSPTASPEPSPIPDTGQPPATLTAQELTQAFVDSPYRVVAIVRPPGSPYDMDFPYELFVIGQRAWRGCGQGDERCNEDATCGSIYTSPICYFFLEPQFVFGANPEPQFVGQWQGELDGLIVDSLVLSSDGKLQFQSAGGDGPCSVQAAWELDTTTAVVRELSRVEQCGE